MPRRQRAESDRRRLLTLTFVIFQGNSATGDHFPTVYAAVKKFLVPVETNDHPFYRYTPCASFKHALCNEVRLSNDWHAATFVESIDVLHGTSVVTDNSGYLILSNIFGIFPWKSRSTFSTSCV